MKVLKYSMTLLASLLIPGAYGASKKEANAFDAWSWHVSAAGSVLHLNDEGSPYRFSVGAGHPVIWDRLTLLGDLVFAYYDVNAVADKHPDDNVTGGWSSSLGIDLSLRYDVFQASRIKYIIDGGVGFQSMLDSPPFPADGSYQNFTVFGGPGILIPAGDRSRIGVSLHWFHISNAWLFSNNSGYDGIQLVLAYEWD